MNEQPIKLGGYALKSSGVTRIDKFDVWPTIHYVSLISGIPLHHLVPLGSTGKTETSGDIDLAIDMKAFDPELIHQRMVNALGVDNTTFNKGTKVGSYAVPIPYITNPLDAANTHNKGLVQVDFMYVNNTTWAEFSYFSAGDKSKYKGAIRTILLSAIAATINDPTIDRFVYDGDLLVVRIGRSWDLNNGVRRIFQYRPKKIKGGGYLASLKTVEPEIIQEHYPDLVFDHTKVVIDEPTDVLNLIFDLVDTEITPSDVETAEQVIDLINKSFDSSRIAQIKSKAYEKFAPIQNKMVIPAW